MGGPHQSMPCLDTVKDRKPRGPEEGKGKKRSGLLRVWAIKYKLSSSEMKADYRW
jgi:hypothetical protein